MKHYMDITDYKEKFFDMCHKGDMIEIQEKIDGANFSFKYNAETDTVEAFSSRHPLSPFNTLRGAYEFVNKLDKEKVKEVLGNRYVLFGEWLVSHTVVYPKEKYHNMYVFDMYDSIDAKWMPQEMAKKAAAALGLDYVPVFYIGPFESWEQVNSYVGKTAMGGEYGEGVVVKNLTRLDAEDNSDLPFYTKIVCDRFKETKPQRKPKEPDQDYEIGLESSKAIVTPARVTKMLNKFVDEGLIPEDWDETNLQIVAKNLPKRIYEDCVKEEPEAVEGIQNFGKFCAKISMEIARGVAISR